jgi:hypothetical protein
VETLLMHQVPYSRVQRCNCKAEIMKVMTNVSTVGLFLK